MRKHLGKITILMAEDDPDDYNLFRDALRDSGIPADLRWVSDGEELMAYLYRRGKFENIWDLSNPDIIFLDLNMPRKDGWEALTEIKANETFRRIPIIVITTSRAEEDIVRSYALGANSYITKPDSFDSLINMIKVLGVYWTGIVELPLTSPLFMEKKMGVSSHAPFSHPV
jgi:CheY-like chemotaxis protein